jgi:hypothetical protein
MTKSSAVAKSDTPAGQIAGPQSELNASTLIYTIFTKAGDTQLIYSATNWVRIQLFLEDAGPVSFGTRQQIGPALSGKGCLLPTSEWVEFFLAKGDRLFLVAEGINRVKFICEQIPWLEQVLRAVGGRR